jgi:hypothetical protein
MTSLAPAKPVMTTDGVFVLAPPCSYSAIVGAMLGRHPELYGFPELHLFLTETVGEWWAIAKNESFEMNHGLLRAVAQIVFGEQTEASVERASGWIRRRLHFSTGLLLEALAAAVYPATAVYSCSSLVQRMEYLKRSRAMFSDGKFIFVSQHPRGYCEAVMAAVREAETRGPVPAWLRSLAFGSALAGSRNGVAIDPQRSWCDLTRRILDFLEPVPNSHRIHVRGEDALSNPGTALPRVVTWLGLRSDPEAIDAMTHPEHSPYAGFGPPSAQYGNAPAFLRAPTLSAHVPAPQKLDGPLSWRSDGLPFSDEVRQLALKLGYS